MQKIVTNLWYDSKAEEAARFYTSLFANSQILRIDHYGEAGAKTAGMPVGSVLTVEFTLKGQRFAAINGGPVYNFTPAISLFINCDTQQEVDTLWEALSADGGKQGPCGWLTDKYGLSWQVVPAGMDALLHDPDPARAERAMAAMLKMGKLDINALREAAK